MLKRAVMAGLNAAGVNVDDLEVAPVPVTRFQVRVAARRRAASRCAWSPDDPQSVVHPLLRRPTASTSPRRRSARSSASSTGRTSAGCSPATSATSASRPGPSSTTRPRSIERGRRRGDPRARASRSSSTTPTARPSFVMPNVLSKLGADVLAVNPYASTPGAVGLRPRRRTPATSPTSCATSGAHLGAVHRPRRRAHHAHRRRGPRAHRRSRRCSRSSTWSRRPPTHGCRVAAAGRRSAATAERIAADARRRDRVDQGVHAGTSWRSAARRRRRLRRAARTAASSSRRSCPPTTPWPPSPSCSSCWPRTGTPAVEGRRPACPRIHVVHETVATPWEQKGMVMRTLVEQADRRARAGRRGEGASTTTAGCSCCPTPRSRSPTCGPRASRTATPDAWPRSTSGASTRC